MQLRIMLAALLFAQLADAATFTIGAAIHGIGLESNGFAGLAYSWNQSFAKGEQAFNKAAELAIRLTPDDGLLEVLVGQTLAELFRLAFHE